MKDGQLKPVYNYLISSNKQFITCYTIEQKTTDTSALPWHMHEFNKMHNSFLNELTGGASFGSEENYEFLHDNNITPYVKFKLFSLQTENGKRIYSDWKTFITTLTKIPVIAHRRRNEKGGYQIKRNQNHVYSAIHFLSGN